jgi:lipid-binding SYLF domain-containing protein
VAVNTLLAQSQETATVESAVSVLDEIMAIPAKQIPQSLLADAHGIAIIPNVVKGGFVVGVRYGKGVLVVRDETGAWKPPLFVTLTGGSVGWQAGLQATDVILVFKTQKSVESVMSGKFTIGADAAAAAGPVGRQAAAATDAKLSAEIYSYSRSRGLFAGVSLDGSVMQVDGKANQAYYSATGFTPAGTAFGQNAQLPGSTVRLLETVARYTIVSEPMPVADSLAPGAPLASLPAGGVQPDDGFVLRQQLIAASQQLQSLLDENWRRYLALPAELYAGNNRPPSLPALQDTLQRYENVSRDARYAVLTGRPEFRETLQLLRTYVQGRSNAARTGLVLPPPPAAGNAQPSLDPRY